MMRRWLLSAIVIAVVAAATLPTIYFALTLQPGVAPRIGYVALLELSGTIAYDESPIALFGPTLTPEDVDTMLERVRRDANARALVLVINSPGGSAAASEEIHSLIRGLAGERTVVAYITEYGASGGYYISLPARTIMASPHSLTGSVGAVAVLINYAELAERLGVKAYVFKSGALKDVGNPFRELNDEDARVLSSLIDSVAETFIERVREARDGKIRDWDEVLTARPYTGLQALEAGLVDKVGTLEDAVKEARRLAGLPEDAPTYWIRRPAPSLLELLLRSRMAFDGRLRLSYEVLLMWPLPEGIDLQYIVR